jgi:DNA-directed RNA polymerase subunit beta'
MAKATQNIHGPFEAIKQNVIDQLTDILTVEGNHRKMVVDKIAIKDDLSSGDIKSQKDAKLKMKSWAVPVTATVRIIDKATGDTISKKRMKVAEIPKVTDRKSFIVDGTEYQVSNQLRMKSGAYVRINSAGQTDEWVNLEKGKNFNVIMKPGNKLIAKFGSTNISAYSLAKIVGADDNKLKKAVGDEVYKAIVTDKVAQDAVKLYRHLFRKAPDNADQAVEELREYFKGTKMDPQVTEKTLGSKYNHVNGDFMVSSIKKIVDVNRGDVTPDNRDELRFKNLMTLEDLMDHRLKGIRGQTQFRIRNVIDTEDDIRKVIRPKAIDSSIKSFFNTSRLSDPTNQVNPVEMLDRANVVTYMGEGGIGSKHQITMRQQGLNNSFMGFVDPVYSPEGPMVGISNRLASGADRKGKEFIVDVVEAKTGSKKRMSPMDLHEKNLAIPGQYARGRAKSAYVTVVRGGEINVIPSKEVDYYIEDPRGLFSDVQNLVPFMSATSGARAHMGAKMITQALPLTNPESPIVQTSAPSGQTYEEMIGKNFSVWSPVAGTVKSVRNGVITIEDRSGTKHQVQYYDHFPTNGPVEIDSQIKVKRGDSVMKGELLADTNYTKDGVLAIGRNLNVAYVPYKGGFTFEDGLVLSQGAADKMASDKVYRFDILIGDDDILERRKFRAYYPDRFSAAQIGVLTDEGIPEVGTVLKQGDPIHLLLKHKVLTEDDIAIGRLKGALMKPYKDASATWDKIQEGTVTNVARRGKEISVYIRATKPFEVGDKLSGRFGNKGIVTKIVPDEEMLRTEDGKIIDLVIDPNGIPTRLNPSQLLETAAAKAAQKAGETYKSDAFTDGNYLDIIQKYIDSKGVSDRETLVDPANGKKLEGVVVGPQYIMQLNHPVEKKKSARSTGKYSLDMAPTKGGEHSAQSYDPLTMFSMLAHGSKDVLREAYAFKSERNDEFWRALQMNEPLPAPKASFAWQKFQAMMQAMGVNVKKEGNMIRPVPMTDDEILSVSSGKIKDAIFVRGKDLRPELGGFFDPASTGGLRGGRWSHFDLAEEMPNPTFEQAILSVLDLKESDYVDIVAGRKYIHPDGELSEDPKNGLTGGRAIRMMLNDVDIDGSIKSIEGEIKGLRGSRLNAANRKLRYLKNLKNLNLDPSKAYMSKIVPVIPPKFRPVYPHSDGTLEQNPVNMLYRDLFLSNKALEDADKLPDPDKADLRESVYESYKALLGFGTPLSNPEYRGFFDIISGRKTAKKGFFQQKLLRKRQDLSGRSTITLDPTLHVDEAGVPESMAWEIFKPLIIKELVAQGMTPVQAISAWRDQQPQARRAMDMVSDKHPVLLNRSPTLHKFGIMAFRPRIHQGKSITINPLVTKGFNADFDGDTMSVHVPVGQEAVTDAARMFPSRNLFSSSGRIMMSPDQASQLGLYLLTREGNKTNKSFANSSDAVAAYKAGNLRYDDIIKIGGKETSVGRSMVNNILPENAREPSRAFDKGTTKKILESIAKNNPKDMPAILDYLKDVGFEAAYESGASMGLSDLRVDEDKKKRILDPFAQQINRIHAQYDGVERDRRAISVIMQAQDAIDKFTKSELGKPENTLNSLIVSGAKGGFANARQMVTAPVASKDIDDKVIPVLVNTSYSQGMDPKDFWVMAAGARKGMVDRSVATAEPGYLNKALINTAIDMNITLTDCRTERGLEMDINDPEILDRHLSVGIGGFQAGDLVSPALTQRLKSKNVKTLKVRTPIYCEAVKGICAKCAGLDENGRLPAIGTAIGVISSQSITEPTTQLTMKTFHSGGAVSGEQQITSAFDTVKKLLHLPKHFPGKAILSSRDGKVDEVEKHPLGGWRVAIGGQDHHIPARSPIMVKKGDRVKKGDKLSAGPAHPTDVMDLQGPYKARERLADELWGVYKQGGTSIQKKHFETVARSVINSAIVHDSFGADDVVAGDVVSYDWVDAKNRRNVKDVKIDDALGAYLAEQLPNTPEGKILDEDDIERIKREGIKTIRANPKPIDFQPVVKGITMMPLTKRDWLSQLAFSHLKDAIRKGVPAGWKSNIHDWNPIPGLVYGAEFGQKQHRPRY